MIDFQKAVLSKLVIHKTGNKILEEGVTLSNEVVDITRQTELGQVLKTYFLSPFKEPAYYQFHHVSSLELNEIYTISSTLFGSTKAFIKKSKDIANILYQYSNHPKIKSGELYIAYFEECNINNEITDAIGIFKSENKETFLKVFEEGRGFLVSHDEGTSIKKPDKACLILNIKADEGFIVCILDNQNVGNEAQYWKDEFLKLKPLADNYFQTQNYLSLAKDFVTDRLDEEFEVSKADQIDYLNRSINYFKKNEHFNEQDFALDVFEHKEVIKSFKKFKGDFENQHEVDVVSEFEISAHAVKRQARIFKSVLKLDRNFHIYIHGDGDLIEKGVDVDGRKYYKIYYKEES
ncbi:MAG: nucleoid-associated protein [Cyclobacteriaceae bacterium]